MEKTNLWLTIISPSQQLWNGFWEAISGNDEPHIWYTVDHGHSHWHAYDPRSERSICVDSEADLRDWLEHRYYAH